MDARKRYLFTLLLIGTAILFFQLGERDLWEPDETRYAVVAREMRETGQWILPHFNGDIYGEKPPLFFWFVNLSVFFLGEDSELVNRLPSALTGLITLFVTFLFGERLFHRRVGFFAALILATCPLFPQMSRWMMLDSLMTLLFLLTLFCFYLGYEKDQGRRRYYLLAGLFMGLGVLTKGPVVYLSLPILLIFALLQRGLKKFWNRDLLLGFSLSLTIVLFWLIPACILGGEQYTNRILFEQTLGRLSGHVSHVHAEPFFFYFIRFPIEFIPWIVFLPTAFIFACRQRGITRRKELLLLSIWFILIFVFFTISRGKKDNYILPLYPAAAILMGWFWDALIQSQEREKGVIVGLLILTCVGIAGFALMSLGFPWKSYPHLLPYRFLAIVMSSTILVGFIVSLLSFVDGKKWASFLCIVITFTTLHLHLSYWLPQRLNVRWSMKRFSEGILKRMEVGDELKMCFFSPAGLLYYTGKARLEEIRSRDRFLEVLRLPQRVFMVITKGKLDQLKRELRMEFNIIEQERVYWNLVLISNH